MRRTILAVAYYRMSDLKQEMSIGDQRKAVEAYAKLHGYTILREYLDEGISGDATERRKGFQAMIAAAERGEFTAILCWDQDRFGRFDSIEAGRWVYPLRQQGIHLATVSQGVIDWHSFTGRVMYGIQTEAKHQYLTDLSRNVTRGMSRLAEEGKWGSGKPPAGYVIDDNQRLALGAASDIEFVRTVFRWYLEGKSLRSISLQLLNEGRKSSKGQWSAPGLRALLTNRAYLGEHVWNRHCASKYKRPAGSGWRSDNDPSSWTVIPNNHPAIIDQATFDRVQSALAKRKTASTPHKDGGGFIFSGLLYCSHCGHRMAGHYIGNSDEIDYHCHGYMTKGPQFCNPNRVRQVELLPAIVAKLGEKIFNQQLLSKLLEKIRKEICDRSNSAADVGEINREIADINQRLAKAKQRLVAVDADMIGIVQEQIRDLTKNRDALAERAQVAKLSTPMDVESQVQKTLKRFDLMRLSIKQNPVEARTFLQYWTNRIEVTSEKIEWTKKRSKYKFLGGNLFFNPNNLLDTARHSLQVMRIPFMAAAA